MAISSAANARSGRQWPSAGRIAPDRAASSSSGTAARNVRPNTTTGGATCSTATLMKRYGTPQITPIDPNRSQLRRVTHGIFGRVARRDATRIPAEEAGPLEISGEVVSGRVARLVHHHLAAARDHEHRREPEPVISHVLRDLDAAAAQVGDRGLDVVTHQ